MSHSDSCIFCKIIRSEIPSERVFENDEFIAIRDIQPQAKAHFLVIPKTHVESLAEVFHSSSQKAEGGEVLMGKLFSVATQLAKTQGLLPGGFRSVINTGREGGQTVFHLHLHLLGGEALGGRFA